MGATCTAKRITPDWSEQNARVPVEAPTGLAFDSKPLNGEAVVPAPVFGTVSTIYPDLVPAVKTGSIKQAVAAAGAQPAAPPN